MKLYRYNWVWEKEQGVNFLMAKKQPLKVHEDICVFYKKQPTYNPQMTQGEPYKSGLGSVGKVRDGYYHGTVKTQTQNQGTRYPRTIVQFKRETGLHPTQKPVSLIEYLINTYTNEGDTVLDSCMGSFTTAIAAVNTKRNFIGFENDEQYYQAGQERLKSYL
jgi:DNA modification methylase